MTEFYCGGVCVVIVLVFFLFLEPRKILVLLRIKAMPCFLFVGCSSFRRPIGIALTDLLSKLACRRRGRGRISTVIKYEMLLMLHLIWFFGHIHALTVILRVQKYD